MCFPGRPTLWDIHGVQAAQQVPDKQVVTLLPAQPVTAGEVEAQMWSVHVGHDHPVQEPAGVHPCVVMFNPGKLVSTKCVNIITYCNKNVLNLGVTSFYINKQRNRFESLL